MVNRLMCASNEKGPEIPYGEQEESTRPLSMSYTEVYAGEAEYSKGDKKEPHPNLI